MEDNTILDSFSLPDISSLPKGDIWVTVTFNINVNGILEVNAIEDTTGKSLIRIVNKGKSYFFRSSF